MKNRTIDGLMIVLLLAAVGCASDDDTQDAPDGTGGTSDQAGSSGAAGQPTSGAGTGGESISCGSITTDTDAEGNPLIVLNDSQNYSFNASLTIQTIRVNSSSNLLFDWSALTEDLRYRPLDPLTGIDMLEVVLWENITEAELMEDMSSDSVDLANVVGVIIFFTEKAATSAHLFDLQPPAAEFTPEDILAYIDTEKYPPESTVYSVMLAEGEIYGKGNLMIVYIRPDPNETNTEVRITNDSTVLDYTVDMLSMSRITLPSGVANIKVDWTDDTALSTNAIGNEFLPTAITDIMIGHYADKTPEQVQEQFLDIDRNADEMWTKYMPTGTNTLLSELTNEAGEPFTGIDDNGTWLIALMCGDCTSPAPWFLTILEPCTPQ